jgi:hypothetical protein
MKKLQTLSLPVGLLLLSASILMEKTLPSTPGFDFTEGFFMGLSIVLNIYYIIVVISHKCKK